VYLVVLYSYSSIQIGIEIYLAGSSWVKYIYIYIYIHIDHNIVRYYKVYTNVLLPIGVLLHTHINHKSILSFVIRRDVYHFKANIYSR